MANDSYYSPPDTELPARPPSDETRHVSPPTNFTETLVAIPRVLFRALPITAVLIVFVAVLFTGIGFFATSLFVTEPATTDRSWAVAGIFAIGIVYCYAIALQTFSSVFCKEDSGSDLLRAFPQTLWLVLYLVLAILSGVVIVGGLGYMSSTLFYAAMERVFGDLLDQGHYYYLVAATLSWLWWSFFMIGHVSIVSDRKNPFSALILNRRLTKGLSNAGYVLVTCLFLIVAVNALSQAIDQVSAVLHSHVPATFVGDLPFFFVGTLVWIAIVFPVVSAAHAIMYHALLERQELDGDDESGDGVAPKGVGP